MNCGKHELGAPQHSDAEITGEREDSLYAHLRAARASIEQMKTYSKDERQIIPGTEGATPAMMVESHYGFANESLRMATDLEPDENQQRLLDGISDDARYLWEQFQGSGEI